ncbi:DUF938 domain-containing protein [Parasphingopyxis marina]|uniref:DUF938 domain-containing protein n=1 Tax=Parasphingopyxis marina TaxID=2761622 RepID=A0A842HWJ4_9SPHN|nr:DUF938 domain-containing protein [Parasphingopyxis marina]MBC2777486.1 DUF938 domain-containing protein [Parasphingopyxis marina]
MSERPWIGNEAGPEKKKHAPATARNRDAIADVLRDVLPETGTVLEIASGSGEHAIHFAEVFPALRWQPSDPDPACLASIAAWSAESGRANIAPPLELDAASADWPVERADAILCINMIHISPWAATEGLMAGAGRLLAPGVPLYLYGPYRVEGRETAPSNLQFDRWLKERDPAWGLRRLEAVAEEAERHDLRLVRVADMPANNLSLIFVRA